jgi:Tfp pilus assembly protein PilO
MKTAFADNRVRRVAALAAVNLLLAVGGWLALVSPQRHHAASAAQQVQTIQTQLQQIAAVTTPIAPKAPVIHTAPLYSLVHAMPATEDEPDLLLTVDQLAAEAGVLVTTLSPQAPQQAAGYAVLPMSLSLSGTYASITSFMRQLRELVSVQHGDLLASGRLFSVTQLSLAPGTTGHKVTATATVDAYVFGTIPGAAPLAVPAPASTTTTGTSTGSTTSTTSTSTTTTTSG